MEHWHESRLVYDGKIVRLRVGDVTLDNGARALREVVEHPGGVCVLPFTGHSVILVRQFRIAVGEYVLEAPAGKIEGGDTPEYRGRRELEEEAGYQAGRMIPVNYTYVSVGYCSEKIYGFLALDLVKTQVNPEEDERIEIVEVPIADVRTGLCEHRFVDGKTAILLYALLNYIDSGAL